MGDGALLLLLLFFFFFFLINGRLEKGSKKERKKERKFEMFVECMKGINGMWGSMVYWYGWSGRVLFIAIRI